MAAAIIVAISVTAAGWAVFQKRDTPPSSTAVRTLAVLPFKPLGPGAADEYLALGMADALITRLASIRGLIVRPTSSVATYTGERVNPSTAGRHLGVDALVDGRFQRAGNRVRVTVQLLDVANGATLWAGSFDEPFGGVFAVQDAICAARGRGAGREPDAGRSLAVDGALYPEHRGFSAVCPGPVLLGTADGGRVAQKHGVYRQAIELDPSYALAFAGLADSLNILGNHGVYASA